MGFVPENKLIRKSIGQKGLMRSTITHVYNNCYSELDDHSEGDDTACASISNTLSPTANDTRPQPERTAAAGNRSRCVGVGRQQ